MLEAADASVSVDVMKNDETDLGRWKDYDRIVLSPGPGLPDESGQLMKFISEVEGKRPVLGICLGLQALMVHYGGKLLNLHSVLHGVSLPTIIRDHDEPLWTGLPLTFNAGRYHSWVADPEFLPAVFRITATDPEGQVMAIRHKEHETVALQFHPESVLTPEGGQILKNWLTCC